MNSLRERKKTQAKNNIVAAASALFNRDGYESVTMREIATAADVSYQTVYNYFPGKARVLHEILLREARSAEQQIFAVVAPGGDGWPGLGPAMDQLVVSVFRMLEVHDRGYWRTITAEMIRQPETFGSLMGLLDAEFRKGFARILQAARDRQEIVRNVDLDVLTQVVIYLIDHAALRVITLPAADADEVSNEVRRQLEIVLAPYLLVPPGASP